MLGIKKLFYWWIRLATAGFSLSTIFNSVGAVRVTNNDDVNNALSYKNRLPSAFSKNPNQPNHPCKDLTLFQVCSREDKKYFPAVYEGALREYKFKDCIINTASDHSSIYVQFCEDNETSSGNDLYEKLVKHCKHIPKKYSEYVKLNPQEHSIQVEQGCPLGIVRKLIRYGIFEDRSILMIFDTSPANIEKTITKFGHKHFISIVPRGINGVEKFIQRTLDRRYKALYDIHLRPIVKARSAIIYIQNGEIENLNAGTEINDANNSFILTDINCQSMFNELNYQDNPFDSHLDFIDYRTQYKLTPNSNLNKNSPHRGSGKN